jgi:hypothetical protein
VSTPIFIYTTPFPEFVASVQVNALIPARHIGAKALYFGEKDDPAHFLDKHKPDILVFTKLYHANGATLAEVARARGIKVIGAFCDLHLDDPIGQINRRFSAAADKVLAATTHLADMMVKDLGRPVEFLEEPLRFHREPPKFNPGATLNIVWCGHTANHDTLEPGIRRLARHTLSRPIHLIITTNIGLQMEPLVKAAGGKFKLSYIPWSPEVQYTLTQQCDMVFIPSLDAPEKRAKGHGRLLEAINAGRWALAYPLPQYRELAEYCYCGDDYGTGIAQALADPGSVLRKLAAGQSYIDTRFAPEVVAAKWQAIFAEMSKA